MRSLASVLSASGADVRFFARALGIDASRIARNFPTIALPAPTSPYVAPAGSPPHAAWAEVDQAQDAVEFSQAAGSFGPDWVIVDHYAFDSHWHDAVRESLGVRITVIDDVADRALSPDLLVDHNLHDDHRRKYAGLLTGDPALLCGPSHALIDPVFATSPRYTPSERLDRIGLFLGGTDPGGVTANVFRGLRENGFAGQIGVVTSSANPGLAALRELVRIDGCATLEVDLPDLATFFAAYDLQIGAGGGATWERLCIGAPSILLALADNQHEVLVPLALHDVATVLPRDWSVPDIAAAVARLAEAPETRRRVSERARLMVDGLGTQRVAAALLEGIAA